MHNYAIYRNYRLSLFLILSTLLFGCTKEAGSRNTVYQKLQVNGQLTAPVQDIFKILQLNNPSNNSSSLRYNPVTTIAAANLLAQTNLLRDEKSERWHTQTATETRDLMQANITKLVADLQKLGLIDIVEPTQKHYRYALVMGATFSTVSKRLGYLVQLIKTGYSFDTVVLLGGERPLKPEELEQLANLQSSPQVINQNIDLNNIKTEAQVMEFAYKFNPDLQTQAKLTINASMAQKPDRALARANTDDTILTFAKQAPQTGSCLVISNNPYVLRQTLVVKRLLDQNKFPTDGAGAAVSESNKSDIIMLMDEFARTLYEENKIKN